MRKLILTRVTLFALLLGAVGCNEGFEPEAGLSPPAENQTNVADSRDQVHYNKTCASQIEGYFENWYKLEHMRQAYSNIVGSTRAESDDIITATHYHYKFIPKDGAELTLLEDCPDLELFAYPLDAIVSEGEYFESENPLLRYAVVPVDKVLPDVEKELLYEMFIPDDSRTRMPTRCSHIDPEMADRLVAEAMRITGNEEEPVNKTRASKWYGRGEIYYYDEILDWYLPLRGVKVRITRAGVTHTAITDSLGCFQMTDGFKYGASYSIIWERADWDIRDGATGQAFYQTNSNVTNEPWFLYIDGGKSIRYATIHKAVYRHFYGNHLGLNTATPSTERSVKISYMDGAHSRSVPGFFTILGGMASDIRIFKNSTRGFDYEMPNIFHTTCHELAHAAHCFTMTKDNFCEVANSIQESWADCVAYYMTKLEYEEITDHITSLMGYEETNAWNIIRLRKFCNNQNYDKNEYYWLNLDWPRNGEIDPYSPLFIDLIDTDNQYNSQPGAPNDEISGYTIQTLNNIVPQAYAIHSLKTLLRNNKPVGVTDADIDNYFSYMEPYWNSDTIMFDWE